MAQAWSTANANCTADYQLAYELQKAYPANGKLPPNPCGRDGRLQKRKGEA
jgi:hypothetical protein